MKKIGILIAMLLLTSFSQAQKMYGFVENMFVSYDIQTKANDTLIVFPKSEPIILMFRTAIDNFNGRYFCAGKLADQIGNFHIINLNTLAIESFPEYPKEIEYDFIYNKIVYQSGGYFYAYHLDNNSLNVINTLHNPRSTIYGKTRTYIPQTHNYLFNYFKDGANLNYTFISLVNTKTGDVDCTFKQVDNKGIKYSLTGFRTNFYTGDVMAHNEEMCGIVNLCNSNFTPAISIPEYHSILNEQMDVYDHNTNTYIVNYYSTNKNNAYKMAFVDVYNNTILEIRDQPFNGKMNMHQLYDKPVAPIIYYQDTLYVPKGNSYRWFRNDTEVENKQSNALKPDAPGIYRCEIQFNAYKTISKPFEIKSTGLNDNAIQKLILFPNPAKDIIHFEHSAKVISYRITDLSGKLLMADQYLASGINIEQLSSGAYIIQAILENHSHAFGKLIIE